MGRIHQDAVRHFVAYPQHRAIVRPFLTAFSVTRAFQRDESAAFFLRAEPAIAEFLAIERELLLIYSPHRDFQARTLTLHDSILSEHESRLDPSGSIIVSHAPDARQILEGMVSKQADRAPIVVFTAPELAAIADLGDLRAQFARQFYRRDVFGYESPLTRDTLFFGRQEVITRMLDRFRSNQNSGLFGLRRIGKSSVLLAVQRRCEQDKTGRALYVDLSNPGRWKLRWRELLMGIVRDISATVPATLLERSRVFALSHSYSEEQAAIRFRTDIQYLCTVVPGKRILLAMDEVEFVTHTLSPAPHWNQDFLPFWQAMRAVHQELAGKFSYILAGVNPYAVEEHRVGGRWDNPLFSTVRVDYLQPFDPATVRTMVRKLGRFSGVAFEEAVYRRLADDFGGHPYLIRQACSRLLEPHTDRPVTLSLADYEGDRVRICNTLEKNVKHILSILEDFYPEEYEPVRQLALGNRDTFKAAVAHSDSFAQHVEGYGLIDGARSSAPAIRIGVVQEYLARLPVSTPIDTGLVGDPEAIQAEVSRRRNRVEMSLRLFLADGLLFAYGDGAAARALRCWEASRRDALSPFAYRQMWDQLYFDELRNVLDQEWTRFEARFRPHQKAEVVTWMNHINRSRGDAHARELKEDDLAYLRVCFARMEEVLGL